jgi:hypothetical protein
MWNRTQGLAEANVRSTLSAKRDRHQPYPARAVLRAAETVEDGFDVE